MWVYSFLLTAALVLGSPYWLFRMATSGRYRAGLLGRLGVVPAELRAKVAAMRVERRGGGGLRPLIWIHAVSVGEVLAAARLVEEFRGGVFHRERPGTVFAVSTTTETGQRLAQERLPGCAVFYFPLDFRSSVRRYLKALGPEMVVLVESELWPRLITECAKAGIPVAVVNARVSDRSFPRYMALKALWRPLLAKIAIFLAQSEESAARLREIGAPRVEVTGNVKYDAHPGKETPLVLALRMRMQGDALAVVCGSTLPGEEAMILDAWPAVAAAVPRALLVIAPRHPDRFDQVALLIKEHGLTALRGTTFSRTKMTVKPGEILLLDTIGDLGTLYGLGAVALVGGSLVAGGGHNPLEPAQLGVPVVMGPSFENFREIVEAMLANDGIRITQPAKLTETLIGLLQDRDEARALGARGRAVSAAQAGASARTASALLGLLPSAAGGARHEPGGGSRSPREIAAREAGAQP
jgi:3-deoxy-D-manno-octulosonic-acid transferase